MSRRAHRALVVPVRRLRVAVALALPVLAGCTHVTPQHVSVDRMDYGQVVADSWKRQTLLNVVRLRYSDAPVFLDVASIINSYTLGGTANAAVAIPSQNNPAGFNLGSTGIWSNTPTVTYQPLMGDRFTRSMLQPIPPASVFQLLQGGWGANLVLKTVVTSMNALRNAALGQAADPGFTELIDALARIQRAGNIGIRVEPRKDGGGLVAVLRRGAGGTELSDDSRRVRSLLGLPEDVSEFELTYGLVPRAPNEVALLTRSMMEIMLQLGFGIDVPPELAASGRALPGQWQPGAAKASPLVHIRSGKEAPADAYSAVLYRGYWYWIDDTDIASKRTFTFLMILFSLAETGQPAVAPVVTVPSR